MQSFGLKLADQEFRSIPFVTKVHEAWGILSSPAKSFQLFHTQNVRRHWKMEEILDQPT
jgi:hypothetical protein